MSAPKHSTFENLFALLAGALFCGFGAFLFTQTGLLTGGTAGLALLLTQMTTFSFGQIFFVLNIPFYWLAWKQMGWRFCLNTFTAILLMSLVADYIHIAIAVKTVEPLFAAIFGGISVGTGMLILFRHQASLGGIGILALYLQNRFNLRAGKFQMAADCTIVIASCFVVSVPVLLISILGALALNMVITLNHRPGRYQIA